MVLALPRRAGVAAVLLTAAIGLAGAAEARASSIFFIRANNIWVSNPDGSAARAVTADGGNGQPYIWVSSAKSVQRLAYLRQDGPSGDEKLIYGTINPDGSGSTVNPDNANMQPDAAGEGFTVSIDPAGDRVAWSRSVANCLAGCGYTSYYAYSDAVGGGSEAYIGTTSAIHVRFGDAAGQTLLFDDFTSDFSGPSMCGTWALLIRAPGATSAPTTVYCVAGDDLRDPALRPDGQLIAAVRGAPDAPGQLVTIPLSGSATDSTPSPTTPLTSAGFGAGSPDFSPDGTAIAFAGPSDTIYTVPAGGGSPSQILADATSPAWSPYTLPGAHTGLALTISAPARQRVVKQRGLVERVACNVPCSLAGVGTIGVGKKTFATTVVTRTLAGGQTANVLLPLASRAVTAVRLAFAHHHRVTAEVGAVAQAAGSRVQKQTAVSVSR